MFVCGDKACNDTMPKTLENTSQSAEGTVWYSHPELKRALGRWKRHTHSLILLITIAERVFITVFTITSIKELQ